MRILILVGLLTSVLAACKRDNPQFCTQDGDCASGVCDTDRFECLGDDELDAGPPPADAQPCVVSQECQVPTAPICDDGEGVCRACESGDECTALYPAAPFCRDDGRCGECAVSADCGDAEPICDDTAAACRACNESAECAARDEARPLCAPNGGCVECLDHADCPSEVCDRIAGTCVAEAAVVYVDKSGSSDPPCGSRDVPCLTIALGLAQLDATRAAIRIGPGGYSDQSIAISSGELLIVGDDATVRPPLGSAGSSVPGLIVSGGAKVTVDGVDFIQARDGPAPHGVICKDSGSRLVLSRGRVDDNGEVGVQIEAGCEATLVEVDVADNKTIGVVATFAAALTLERSSIRNNEQCGVFITSSPFTIVNNFIVDNGDSSSSFAGVQITQTSALSPQLFEFNTAAGNESPEGGVDCTVQTAAALRNNIVYDNAGAQVAGNCTWEFSNIEGGFEGTGNLDMDPMFIAPSAGDYHLDPASPVREMADPSSATAVDVDGDARPQGDGFDLGADEVVPR